MQLGYTHHVLIFTLFLVGTVLFVPGRSGNDIKGVQIRTRLSSSPRVRKVKVGEDGNCTKEMFPTDVWASWACRTEVALQTNWFPSPISGLFSYQVWNGFDGFWQNGCVLETLVNFMQYGGHRRYRTVVLKSLRSLDELNQAYYPYPSFDDMAWYGLSYLRIYEVLNKTDFLHRAHEIYDWNWIKGWDQTGSCGGGMWFDYGLNQKVTITNVQMLQLGAKLYKLTGRTNSTLLQTVRALWRFIGDSQLINNVTWLVADGIDVHTCVRQENYGPTYSSGVLAAGLLHLSEVFNNSGFLDLAHKVANATMVLRSSAAGVLTETCDPSATCDNDALVFKGIFVRHLRYLADASDATRAAHYRKWLALNSRSVVSADVCEKRPPSTKCNLTFTDGLPYFPPTTPVFDSAWAGPYRWSAPMQQASALDLFVSSISPGTRCRGPRCSYDPPIPPLRPLTCKDSPCPPGHACCEYGGGYRTCCTPSQTCVNGFCG